MSTWTRVCGVDGRAYYWNEATDDTTWDIETANQDAAYRGTLCCDAHANDTLGVRDASARVRVPMAVVRTDRATVHVRLRLFTRTHAQAPVRASLIASQRSSILDRVWRQLQQARQLNDDLRLAHQSAAVRSALCVGRASLAWHAMARWRRCVAAQPLCATDWAHGRAAGHSTDALTHMLVDRVTQQRRAALLRLVHSRVFLCLSTSLRAWQCLPSRASPLHGEAFVRDLYDLSCRIFSAYEQAAAALEVTRRESHATVDALTRELQTTRLGLAALRMREEELAHERDTLINHLVCCKTQRAEEYFDAMTRRCRVAHGVSDQLLR